MENWRMAWRRGIAPQLSEHDLRVLGKAIYSDDPRLLHGVVCRPVPGRDSGDCPVLGACAIGYCAAFARGMTLVGEVEEWFSTVIREADERLMCGSAACFLNFWDHGPFGKVRLDLLAEIETELATREYAEDMAVAAPAPGSRDDSPWEHWIDEGGEG